MVLNGKQIENAKKKAKLSSAELRKKKSRDGEEFRFSLSERKKLICVLQGETVVDLGCGAGFDIFLAARKVGEAERAIGVDMSKVNMISYPFTHPLRP